MKQKETGYMNKKKRMYRANQLRMMGEKAVIFRRMYGCDPYCYMDKQIAKGKTGREAEADMYKKLYRIELELRERDIEEAKRLYAEEHNNGFVDATGYDVPFDTG